MIKQFDKVLTVGHVLFKIAIVFLPKAGPEEEETTQSKKSFRSHSVVSQNPETELMLEGDDDAVSLLQEKEIDNLAGIWRIRCTREAFIL